MAPAPAGFKQHASSPRFRGPGAQAQPRRVLRLCALTGRGLTRRLAGRTPSQAHSHVIVRTRFLANSRPQGLPTWQLARQSTHGKRGAERASRTEATGGKASSQTWPAFAFVRSPSRGAAGRRGRGARRASTGAVLRLSTSPPTSLAFSVSWCEGQGVFLA